MISSQTSTHLCEEKAVRLFGQTALGGRPRIRVGENRASERGYSWVEVDPSAMRVTFVPASKTLID